MVNLIIISAAVLILVSVILKFSVKKLVANSGEVIITKSLFSNEYSVCYDSEKLILGKGFVINNSVISDKFESSFLLSDSRYLTRVLTKYSVKYNLDNLNISSLRSSSQDIRSLVSGMITSLVGINLSKYSLPELLDNSVGIMDKITDEVKGNLLDTYGLDLISLDIDYRTSNYLLISSLNKKEDEPLSEVEKAKIDAKDEVEIYKINMNKNRELSQLRLESQKSSADSEVKSKEIELNKQRRLQEESDKYNQFLKDSESEKQLKSIELENKKILKELDAKHESEMADVESSKNLELKKLQSKIDINNKEKEEELNKIKNSSEITKENLRYQKEIHEELKDAENRKLEISVILPANKEAEKNKILANNKAEVKMIDTKSAIESSKLKLKFKEEESEITNNLKIKSDEVDLKSYTDMINAASGNENLAIKWKELDTRFKISKVQAESMAKMNLDKLVITNSSMMGSDFISESPKISDENK